MAGIVMDTATFAHPNATPRTLAVSAALVEAGAPLSDISRRLYRTKPDAQLRLFGRVLDRLETADDGRIVWSTLTDADLGATGADRRHSEGIIDLLAQAEAAEVAILFKEAGAATRLSVRTKPGGVDATVLTGSSAAAGTPGRPAPRSTRRSPRPAASSLAEAARLVAAAGADDGPTSLGPGLDGILVVAKPAGPTSHDVVALVRRLAATKRVGHGGTLDPFASGVLPVFLGHATRVVEYHLGDRKAYRATVCFGASSTTDDLEGELTPRPGAAPTREAVEAALPGSGAISQRPPAYSAIKVGGRRAYAHGPGRRDGRAAPREVTIHALELVSWDGTDRSGRSRSSTSSARPARTSGRSPATSARPSGAPPTSVRADRTASGPFTLEDAVTLDDLRAAAADGPAGLLPLLRPIDAGLEAFPDVTLTDDEVGGHRPRPVHPTRRRPAAAAEHYRLRDADGRARRDRRGVRRPARAGQGLRGAHGRPRRRLTSAMHVVDGIDALRPSLGPAFVVVGVFDGLHLGHAYLLEHLVREAPPAAPARPSSPSTTTRTRS